MCVGDMKSAGERLLKSQFSHQSAKLSDEVSPCVAQEKNQKFVLHSKKKRKSFAAYSVLLYCTVHAITPSTWLYSE